MNDRIKELAEQAGEWYMANSKEFPFPQEWNKKFVELIIEECIDHAFHNGDNIDYMKKHFGV